MARPKPSQPASDGSPSAAASKYVDQEIATFQALGRGARVYALIVAGVAMLEGIRDEVVDVTLIRGRPDRPR